MSFFHSMHNKRVRYLFETFNPVGVQKCTPATKYIEIFMNNKNYTQGEIVDLVKASDIIPEATDWIWEGWLAAGKMHILGGSPGTGKTTISLSLAAVLSSGGIWPGNPPKKK